jgi:predicted Rossmann fold nucleotide-binding protein DprA/Smf involved in DNA uptake
MISKGWPVGGPKGDSTVNPKIAHPQACITAASVAVNRCKPICQVIYGAARGSDQVTIAVRACVMADADKVGVFGTQFDAFHIRSLSSLNSD